MAEYFVDTDVGDNGNAGTSEGSGNAWATRAHAYETGIPTAGEDTTNGDILWVKGTAAETQTKNWPLGTWLTGYSATARLRTVGYQTTKGDGKRGPQINGTSGQSYTIDSGTLRGFEWHNHVFKHNGNANPWFENYQYERFINCEFSRGVDTTGGFTSTGRYTEYLACLFADLGTTSYPVRAQDGVLMYCTFIEKLAYARNLGANAYYDNGVLLGSIVGNDFILDTDSALRVRYPRQIVENNIRCANAVDGSFAIEFNSATDAKAGTVIANNLISGYDGLGGAAISADTNAQGLVLINNKHHNCTAFIDGGATPLVNERNVALGFDPFPDAASDSLRPDAQLNPLVTADYKKWPSTIGYGDP